MFRGKLYHVVAGAKRQVKSRYLVQFQSNVGHISQCFSICDVRKNLYYKCFNFMNNKTLDVECFPFISKNM